MATNPVQRLFIWLSGADRRILWRCTRLPDSERRKFALFGATVLIPAILGLFSMAYALSTVVKERSIYLTGGALWSVTVLTFDRFLAATFYKSTLRGNGQFVVAFLFRLVFAGFIGVVVSHPLVLFLFDGTIKQQLADMRQTRREDKLKQIQQIEDAQNASLSETLNDKTHERFCLVRVLEAEQSGVGGAVGDGHGQVCGYASGLPDCRQRCENLKVRIGVADAEIRDLHARIEQNVTRVAKVTANEPDEIQRRYDGTQADYLGRVRALAALERTEPHVRLVRIFLMTFFVFLDTLVVTLKAVTPAGEYEEIRDTLLFEAQKSEETRREVIAAWVRTAFKAAVQAEFAYDAVKNEILALVKAAKAFIQELDDERAAFDEKLRAIARNVKSVRDEETRRTFLERLGDVRATFNAAWGKAMTKFQDYLRNL